MDRIGFGEIARVNEAVLTEHETTSASALENILAADGWARDRAIMMMGKSVSAI